MFLLSFDEVVRLRRQVVWCAVCHDFSRISNHIPTPGQVAHFVIKDHAANSPRVPSLRRLECSDRLRRSVVWWVRIELTYQGNPRSFPCCLLHHIPTPGQVTSSLMGVAILDALTAGAGMQCPVFVRDNDTIPISHTKSIVFY